MSARLSDELPKDEDGVLFALLGHLEVRNNIIANIYNRHYLHRHYYHHQKSS